MAEGIILKALSGFYYLRGPDGETVTCRARGRLRHQKTSPLVGDRARYSLTGPGVGTVEELLPRKNQFHRPAVANVDQLVILASAVPPKTDLFLVDRVISLAESKGCQSILCVNKSDLARAEDWVALYRRAGFPALSVSARTGEGLEEFSALLAGKVSAFTGNSGVGKSSLLNALEPAFALPVGEVSQKLGRGRHTTRHVELFSLKNGALAADTPGFSAFDGEEEEPGVAKQALAATFREFEPYVKECYFTGCSHRREKGCALLRALAAGEVAPSRHASYVRLYEQAARRQEWQRK